MILLKRQSERQKMEQKIEQVHLGYVEEISDLKEEIDELDGMAKLVNIPYAEDATKLLFGYIKETQKIDLKHINKIIFLL